MLSTIRRALRRRPRPDVPPDSRAGDWVHRDTDATRPPRWATRPDFDGDVVWYADGTAHPLLNPHPLDRSAR